MRKRKTIEVTYLKDEVNRYLKNAMLSQQEKKALCFLLENVLMETNNYRGFKYNFRFDEWSEKERSIEFNREYI
jgi:hypothetical protein